MELQNFLDKSGRVKVWPRKQAAKELVLSYIVGAFEMSRDYAEKEVNSIISERHTFGDFFLIRRELVDRGYLGRTPTGSRYWKIERTDPE